MSVILPVSFNNKPCYNILIEKDYEKFYEEVQKFDILNRRLCIVTETNVGPHYANQLRDRLAGLCKEVYIFTFDAGESSKNLDVVYKLYEFLIQNKFDRKDVLIALGGGVVGDLTGFTAATYLRGIRFIQMPTSLLSQVDSSIGGKTGVDFNGYKNMVGAFYQPILVYINIETLKTLPIREYLSGMGEIIKHGFIKDKGYLKWLNDNSEHILNLEYDALEYMICESCMIKRAVVEYDPKETLGERALLNFGHTLGHAIEKNSNFSLLHGECVALGMLAALEISYTKGYISEKDLEFSKSIIRKYNLPTTVEGLSKTEVVEATKSDKKMEADTIKFILLKSLGNAIIDTSVSIEEMDNSLEGIVSVSYTHLTLPTT